MGNIRANPFIYKSFSAEGDVGPQTILFQEAGAAGGYNRSNRSLAHMVENMAPVLAGLWPCSLVVPWVRTFGLISTVGRPERRPKLFK